MSSSVSGPTTVTKPGSSRHTVRQRLAVATACTSSTLAPA